MAEVFFLVAAYWGCILGLLTRDLKKVFLLIGTGLFGGFICLIAANLGGLVLLMMIATGRLLWLAPPLFLIGIYYFFKRNEKMISIAFFILFIYTAADWVIIICNLMISTDVPLFSHKASVFALTGLIIGYSYGFVVKKPKTMAVFGLIGFSLGSYWITSLHYLFESTNNSAISDGIVYIFVLVTAGAFLVAGLYYPEKRPEIPEIIPGVREEPPRFPYPDVTE